MMNLYSRIPSHSKARYSDQSILLFFHFPYTSTTFIQQNSHKKWPQKKYIPTHWHKSLEKSRPRSSPYFSSRYSPTTSMSQDTDSIPRCTTISRYSRSSRILVSIPSQFGRLANTRMTTRKSKISSEIY